MRYYALFSTLRPGRIGSELFATRAEAERYARQRYAAALDRREIAIHSVILPR